MLKRLTFTPVFSNKLFGLKPDIFDRILLRCIWGELYTRYYPLIAWFSHVQPFKIFAHLFTAMIRGAVPAENDALSFILLTQKLDKYHGPSSIRSIRWDHDDIAGSCINSAIIGLFIALIGNWQHDTLIPRPPNIPARITPDKVAFVDIEYDHRAFINFRFVCFQEVLYFFFFYCDTLRIAFRVRALGLFIRNIGIIQQLVVTNGAS